MVDADELKVGMPQISRADATLFILGSLPGERSLAEARYYAFPTNQFWRLLETLVGEGLHGLAYDARLAVLRAHGIGLWDVVGAARRQGSGDAAIRDATHNDIGGLKRDYPDLRAIAFNGGLAAREGRRLLAGVAGLELIALPSSSAAYASMPFAEKAAAWARLKQYLRR